MTLDEAIRRTEIVAEIKEKQIKNGDWEKDSLTERNCIKSAEEHRQLAEWFKDYKRLKEQQSSVLENPNKCDLIRRQAAVDAIQHAFDRETLLNSFVRKVAVDALKTMPSVKPQESCVVPDTNVGDIISKQTVLDTISELNAISFYEAQEDSKECYYEIRQAIKDLSPVKPQEPKTGHWIVHPKGIYAHLICDKCLSNAPYDCRTDYCPSCGAKMEIEQNG